VIVHEYQQISKKDEIDIQKLFVELWKGKWIIFVVTILFGAIAVIYSLNLPNIYKSDVLLAPVTESSGLKISGELGGLAALAGVNLGNSGGEQTAIAIEILKSREFLGRFIRKYNLFVPLMAADGWDPVEKKLLLDKDLYDEVSNTWLRNSDAFRNSKPSLLETYDKLLGLLSIELDKQNGMVTLSIMHYSPYLAQKWASLIVSEINEEMRTRELDEAQSSIDFLTNKLADTELADIKRMLYSLIEEQSKTVMLANVREEYVFKTIDPAVVPEKKYKPSRAIICIFSVMVGFVLSVLFLMVRSFVRSK